MWDKRVYLSRRFSLVPGRNPVISVVFTLWDGQARKIYIREK